MIVHWAVDTVKTFWAMHFTFLLFLVIIEIFLCFYNGAKSTFPLQFSFSFARLKDIFFLSKVNHLLKSKDSKMCWCFSKRQTLYTLKCIYKNDSRKVAFTELPPKNHPSMINLHRKLPPDNCVHKVYIIQSTGC